eukprot:TRINITY_DN5009_c0_g4_i3.p1 TRINITY_DN5009_c0_g4~~TRINITY_DN5009_c0_g4_i3.p1  ORF type:complete len:282 (+),score=60.67 TRINITY_DN5009_c0_g4_i3:91-936(+)
MANRDEAWIIGSNDFQIDEKSVLGRGGFGQVYVGQWAGKKVAIKKLFDVNFTKRAVQNFKKEVQLSWVSRHPNIITLYGACLEPNNMAMVMEYMEGGSLHGVLHDDDIQLSWSRRLEILRDITAGVLFLHRQNIVHRDLKSLNVLLTSQFVPKISDFGLSTIKIESEASVLANPMGTIRWCAPEVMQGQAPDAASDIWSLGLLAAELATRDVPYGSQLREPVIAANLANRDAQNLDLKLPHDIPDTLARFIGLCVCRRPSERSNAQQLLHMLDNAIPCTLR